MKTVVVLKNGQEVKRYQGSKFAVLDGNVYIFRYETDEFYSAVFSGSEAYFANESLTKSGVEVGDVFLSEKSGRLVSVLEKWETAEGRLIVCIGGQYIDWADFPGCYTRAKKVA